MIYNRANTANRTVKMSDVKAGDILEHFYSDNVRTYQEEIVEVKVTKTGRICLYRIWDGKKVPTYTNGAVPDQALVL